MFTTVTVDPSKAESLEQLGTKRKFWFTDDKGVRVLFKAEERNTGEDWAEKLACELAGLLGLPHVQYELAEEQGSGIPGVICESCSPASWSLMMGNELLLARDPAYPADDGRKYKVREHTVEAVAEVVRKLELPPDPWRTVPVGIVSALDVFIGYVLLDAWIANQDRHHQNWAALDDSQKRYLAPSFDHGASMARNLQDDERQERLTTRDANRQIPAFVRKARSAFYAQASDTKPLGTFEAWQAFAALSQSAETTWLDRLRAVDETEVARLLAEVPTGRMSPVCREFTQKLLTENKNRLVEGAKP
ncbi:MAG: hypothetical protein LC104_19225 [Bacteroidales bacterium]|nr:hypothetical protein [Bacteroidales bacterium]